MSATVAVLVAYLLVLIALAIWSRRETESLSGFFLAGKKLPYWVVAFSTNATGESGWLLLGLTGMGYAVGAQAYWVVVGEVIGIALSWTLISRRLKRLSDETDSITLPDVIAARFNDSKHILRSIAVVIILTMVCAYVTAQMVASGKALSSFVGMDYSSAVIVGAIIIIAYTFVGGYKAVAYTDVVQGVLMLGGLIIVPAVAVSAAGGWQSVTSNLAAQDPGLLSMWNITDSGFPGWIALVSFLAIGLPFLGVPQLMVRFMSARDEDELKKARILSVIVILLFDVGAVTAGMAGRALFPGLDDAETIFPLLSTELFPPLITGVMMVVVLSAIMSTVDSLLLLASSAVVRDTLQKIVGSTRSDKTLAGYGKFVTILIGVIGVAFAIGEVKFIFWFVLFAWSGLGAAFGPVIICMLYYKRTTLPGVAAGMLGGFLTSVIWVAVFKAGTYELYEMIPGFIVGMTLTLLVSQITRDNAGA
ncbi:MAG: sodium/proline symporter [Gammaproteobacteria bacterium]|nr:MAG: sodium/proline symporter [Gammaproteobacteria bacterium]